mmetsp:Transcript_9837/g.28616  ORF Transcript_9837/g.28616 Transcript_9837/m.28616 type:complete len:212 (-) Transcript_9837:132-767(-)
MNLTQVLRAKAFEIILLDSRRISVKDGPVNRAATETISPVSSRAPRLLVTSPSRVIFGPSTAALAPPGSSPSSHRPSLPAISHLPRPLARQYGALLCQSGLPIPHRRLLLLPCRLERGRRRLEGGGRGRLQRLLREPLLPLDGYMRGMVLRRIVVVWENHLADLACCRSAVRADRGRDDKVSVATIVGANQPSACADSGPRCSYRIAKPLK